MTPIKIYNIYTYKLLHNFYFPATMTDSFQYIDDEEDEEEEGILYRLTPIYLSS